MAAVSVLLYSGDEELQVRGPIQISLPLGHRTHLRASDTVPAWAFNLKTGMNKDHRGATSSQIDMFNTRIMNLNED